MYLFTKEFTHVEHDYTPPDLRRADDVEGLRLYELPSGNWGPSVTTVTGYPNRAFFEQWRQSTANRKKGDEACVRGDQLHASIEAYLNNTPLPECMKILDNKYQHLLRSLLPKLGRIDNIRMLETFLFSEKLMMGGTVDCIAEYDGVLSIIDFKGSFRMKQDKWIQSYRDQAAVYAAMYEERTGVSIEQYVILIASEDLSTQVFTGKPKDRLEGFITNCWSPFFKEHRDTIRKQNELFPGKGST